jgi:hypothetical protein
MYQLGTTSPSPASSGDVADSLPPHSCRYCRIDSSGCESLGIEMEAVSTMEAEPPIPRLVRRRSTLLTWYSQNTMKTTCGSTYVKALWVMVPIGLVAGALDWPAELVFLFNLAAIVPLASSIASAIEDLSTHTGRITSGVLKAALGNAVELIVRCLGASTRSLRRSSLCLTGCGRDCKDWHRGPPPETGPNCSGGADGKHSMLFSPGNQLPSFPAFGRPSFKPPLFNY